MLKLSVRKQQPVPELPASRPRPVQMTATGILVAVIGTLLPAAALVSGFWLHAVAAGGHVRKVTFWTGPSVALALVLPAFFAWQALRKQWMLLSDGRQTSAVVTRWKKVRSQHEMHYAVYYEFRTMSDSLVSGRYNSRRSPPEVGTTIRVVYDPDNPQRSGRYPFSLVRPVLSSQP